MEDNFTFNEQKFMEERERYRSTAGWPTTHIETDSIGRETINGQPIPKRHFQESVSKAAYLFDRKTSGLTDEEKIAIYNMIDAAVDAIFIRYRNVKSGKAEPSRFCRTHQNQHIPTCVGNVSGELPRFYRTRQTQNVSTCVDDASESIKDPDISPNTKNGIYIDAGIDYHIIHIPDRYGNMKKIKLDSSFFIIEDDE